MKLNNRMQEIAYQYPLARAYRATASQFFHTISRELTVGLTVNK